MTDEQLRVLVREEVARQLGMASATPTSPARMLNDPSHARFPLPTTGDGMCIIEPRVLCAHCGYCKSYGH
jgi:hypothetical protein